MLLVDLVFVQHINQHPLDLWESQLHDLYLKQETMAITHKITTSIEGIKLDANMET